MSTRSARPRSLLAVGAFERDNFGDLLYRELLAHYAGSSWDITWGAPVVGPDAPHGVVRWADALSSRDFDAVWAGGGEVGSTPPDYALLTSFGETALADRRSDPVAHRRRLADEMGGVILDPPYIPRPGAWPRHAGLPMVVNSVGISAIGREPESRRIPLVATIREATAVSVRDSASSRLLDGLGIAHSLVPDLAHVVATVHPVPAARRDVAVVQLNAQSADAHGVAGWAGALHAALPSLPIRILLAGLAPAHDSPAIAAELRRALVELDPQRQVTVSDARGIWDRIEEIATAAMWIGSSLHGRIIASAYGVPRISFAKPKVDAYAADWDGKMPYGVTPDLLPTAVARLLGSPIVADGSAASAAESNVSALLRHLAAPRDAVALTDARARNRRLEAEALREYGLLLEAESRRKDAVIQRLRAG